jgi:hypothetical protein
MLWVGLGGTNKNTRCVQSESSDARWNKTPNESQVQVAVCGGKNDMELDQNNNSSNPVAPKKLFSRNCLPFFCPLSFFLQ